jgi:hypothetical protein
MNTITGTEFFKKVEDGVSGKLVWHKPLLLLTQNGSDYNYIVDIINERYQTRSINSEATYFEFVRDNNKLQMSLNGVICDGHHTDVDLYKYLGGPLAYDEKIHRYCVNLIEYEAKPVISLICVSDNNCSVENIPEWMEEEFEISMLELPF